MDLITKITALIEPSLAAMGYTLVMVRMADGSRRKTLTVMAERRDDQPMSFDDCTEISRTVSTLLEVEDPIATAYDLEVCSPGLDRPLVKLTDYIRFQGQEAKLETMLPVDGRKRFRGIIKAVADGMVTITMPEGFDIAVPFSHIKAGKLMPQVLAPAQKPQHKPNKKKAKR